LVDGEGGPLGVVLAAANVNDQKLLGETIEAIVIERPEPTAEKPQHLCLDASYDNPTGRAAAAVGKYTAHVVPVRKQKRSTTRKRGQKARRWVVERTLAWLCKCRGILIRYDKKDGNYLGLIQLACALFWYRRLDRLAGKDTTQTQLHRS
jgi:putative transposase